ncbi:MAG: R2-like ligand-binding oxidase [Ardenticatenaceae bacterium]|nr:R2-like ligand-binding oxidase [Ardenticatenaceae bacterium]
MIHETFATTSRELHRESPPMRLYEKAKKLGIWNPGDIDFTQDKVDWQQMSDDERDVLLRLTAMFQAGEEAVTLDLLPLIMTIAKEGRIEEEMYLTTFLFEEAKHTDFFNRFLHEVVQAEPDLSRYHGTDYRTLFYEALPQALQALQTDPSPAAQVKAAVTYNMIVEGVLAETGYHAYFQALERNNLLPGQRQGIALLKQDESRHIAYGIFLISRLMAADPNLWEVVEETMNELLMPALAVVGDVFEQYDPMPFGLVLEDFMEYATNQFNKRIERIEKARGATLEEVFRVTQQAIEAGDA